MMRARLVSFVPCTLTVLLAMSVLSACTKLTESTPVLNRYGAINITAKSTSTSGAKANATVIFFQSYSAAVPNSATQQSDQCTFASVDTTLAVTQGVSKAGDAVAFTIGATNTSLPYDLLLFRYANLTTAPITYASGDVVQVVVPGATDVFPASNISVRLAEPMIPGSITLPTSGSPLAVTWNAASDTTSAVILSLRYANPSTSAYGNEQIFCALRDDGKYEIPASALTAFLASPNNRRSLQLTRWRTNQLLIDAHTLLHIATSVDSTIVFP